MEGLKYFEILKELKQLRETQAENSCNTKIKVLSNITVNQLSEILEYGLRKENVPAEISIGNYDNIVQDSLTCSEDEIVILFWELINIIDGFEYEIDSLDEEELDSLIIKVKYEMDLVLNNLKGCRLVLWNLFHSLPYSTALDKSIWKKLVSELNSHLKKHITANVHLIDTNHVIARQGEHISFDIRNYFSSKAFYSVDFFKSYTKHILPVLLSVSGKVKKALILDCDNTLWKGVIGEDGMDGIRLSKRDKGGLPYYVVQRQLLNLYNKGVLLCLCSKNNPEDIDEVLAQHGDMQLRNEHFVVKKVNWEDKVSNLRAIATELNIGLDSLVFVDDADFEVNLVREALPEVNVYQVPEKSYQYPIMMREIAFQFYNPFLTKEDKEKSRHYLEQKERDSVKKQHRNIEDYLRSLNIEICLHQNNEDRKSVV